MTRSCAAPARLAGVAVASSLAALLAAPGSVRAAEPPVNRPASSANDGAPVESYPLVKGGAWARGPNLKDATGKFQPRQEHAAAVLNGFVYLIGGFVPIVPAPTPTENEPEPFPFAGTGDVLVYTPKGVTVSPPAVAGAWASLPAEGAFPKPDMHHIMAVTHQGRIWTFGGHAGPFTPTDDVFVFTPASTTAPAGTWGRVRVSDGAPCGAADECLKLPSPRAAGAAVSFGNRIYVMGGVVPAEESLDPVNRSIETTDSVIYVDTTAFPLEWKTARPMRDSREHFNAVVLDGRIWVFQGRNETSTHMREVESMEPDKAWRKEQDAPVGASANILAAVGERVFSFGGEFIASNISGTLHASQVFDVKARTWSRLEPTIETAPLDATGADAKHGTYGVAFVEEGVTKVMAPGGAATAWFDPMSKVHVFTPPAG